MYDLEEMLETLDVTKTTRRAAGAGTWVIGTIGDHRHKFNALIFPEHAECESYELDRSKISKLWIRDEETGRCVCNFDRGWDIRPATPKAAEICDFFSDDENAAMIYQMVS